MTVTADTPPTLTADTGKYLTITGISTFQIVPAYYNRIEILDWFKLLDESPEASGPTSKGVTFTSDSFPKPETVKITVKAEPVVTKNADGTWTINFKARPAQARGG